MSSIMNQKAFSGSALQKPLNRQRTVVVQAAKAAVKSKAGGAAMVCVDCGYIYDGSQGPFESLPSGYKCPVCDTPKKRFKGMSGASKQNDPKSMQQRRALLREQLEERGEKVEEDASFLYVTAASTLAFLGAFAYFSTTR